MWTIFHSVVRGAFHFRPKSLIIHISPDPINVYQWPMPDCWEKSSSKVMIYQDLHRLLQQQLGVIVTYSTTCPECDTRLSLQCIRSESSYRGVSCSGDKINTTASVCFPEEKCQDSRLQDVWSPINVSGPSAHCAQAAQIHTTWAGSPRFHSLLTGLLAVITTHPYQSSSAPGTCQVHYPRVQAKDVWELAL